MTKPTHIYKVRLEHQAPWVEPLAAWAEDLATDGPRMQAIMRRLMLGGLFPRLYARFMASVKKAQNIQFKAAAKGSSLTPNQMIRARVAFQKAQKAQQEAYSAMRTSGSKGGSFEEVERAQRRMDQVLSEIRESSSGSNQEASQSEASRVTLAAISAGLFRQRQADILRLLTSDPVMLRTERGLMAAAGPVGELDSIKTPSATPWLSQTTSKSPHSIFWRHLEYGTGDRRKNDPQNNPLSSTDYQKTVLSAREARFVKKGGRIPSWYFGGLGLFGSEPMNVLTDHSRSAHKDYYEALVEELDAAIRASLPTWEGGPVPNKPGWVITQQRTL